MTGISLCMIVRNEEAVLERCLKSISPYVEEIVIVDTGSADSTKEIAAGYTDQIYDYLWQDDFAAARNFAFSKGKEAFLMWMDADDVLPEGEGEKLLALKKELESWDTVKGIYDAAFDESGNPTFSYERERILRNCEEAKWVGCVHEVIVPFGRVHRADIRLEHRKKAGAYSDRNLRIYEKALERGEALDQRGRFYYGRELFYHRRFGEAEEVFRLLLQEKELWLENRLEAVRLLSHCLVAQEREEEGFSVLLEGLRLAPPTGELCCDIGAYFFGRQEWANAAFWYRNALHAEKRLAQGAFVQEECYGYLPCIQLCVCHDRLGEGEQAEMYNEMAGVLNPRSEAVERNRAYFRAKKEAVR